MSDLLFRVDRWLGDGVSEGVCRHHRRRLGRLGWSGALDPSAGGWAAESPVPRAGNAVEVLIDGAEALPRIAAELERARSHVHIAGWYFSADFALAREGAPSVVRNLLAELAERVEVRVLVWAGAPLPLFRPSRKAVREMRDRLIAGTKIQCGLDAHERPMHCHHEKTIVIDDRVAFVGGIDLTSEAGDRYDSSDHPARATVGWHDASARIEGPAVMDVAEHFRMRWHEVTGKTLPPVSPQQPVGETELQIVRTVPERIYKAVPNGDFRILESYLRALKAAERFIYLENQFLWSPEIATVLIDKLTNPPSSDFRLVVLLRRSRTMAPTTLAACSANWSKPTPTRVAWSLARCMPGRNDSRPCLRARQDRDRRRPLADARLCQPERTLPLQRHRDEHRHPRPRTRHSRPGGAYGQNTSSSTSTSSPQTPPRPSTAIGSRSARSNSPAATTASPSPTDSPASPTSQNDQGAYSARSTDSWSTANQGDRPSSPFPR